jgi:hypothetical protein
LVQERKKERERKRERGALVYEEGDLRNPTLFGQFRFLIPPPRRHPCYEVGDFFEMLIFLNDF